MLAWSWMMESEFRLEGMSITMGENKEINSQLKKPVMWSFLVVQQVKDLAAQVTDVAQVQSLARNFCMLQAQPPPLKAIR